MTPSREAGLGHRRDPTVRLPLLFVLALLALFATVGVALRFGAELISLARAWSYPESIDRMILLYARAPRIALGVLAGAGLASVGVAFQALLRNPLAEPYMLGVSGGAALGATSTFLATGLTPLGWLGASMVPLSAAAGGIAATAIVYAMVRGSRAMSGSSILLAGVVLNAIAAAAITFVKTLLSASKAQELLYWLMGFLDVPSTASLVFVGLYVALGSAFLLRDAGTPNLLALGDEAAGHLGVDVRALERRVLIACSCSVGAIVSITGLIGFVGLLVPLALRRTLGPDIRLLLPMSLLTGAATLVLCDLLSRVMFRWIHTEPPVGAVTALAGGPLFLFLLRNRPPNYR